MREVEARRQGGCREVGGEWRLSLGGGQDGQQMVGKLNWKSETWNPPCSPLSPPSPTTPLTKWSSRPAIYLQPVRLPRLTRSLSNTLCGPLNYSPWGARVVLGWMWCPLTSSCSKPLTDPWIISSFCNFESSSRLVLQPCPGPLRSASACRCFLSAVHTSSPLLAHLLPLPAETRMHTLTCTHVHTRTSPNICAHMHNTVTHTCALIPSHTCTHSHTCIYMCTHSHTFARVHMCTQSTYTYPTHSHICIVCTNTLTCTHVQSYSHTNTHIHIVTLSHVHIYTHICTHSQTRLPTSNSLPSQ